jgi:hypothetical protein
MREAGSFGCRLERITIRVSARRLVNDLATLVDEPGGRRDLGPAEGEHRLSVAVVDARIGDGRLLEEVLGSLAVILDVEAEKGDLAGVSLRGLGEERELLPARRTPRAPLVDDHGVAPQLSELRLRASVALSMI